MTKAIDEIRRVFTEGSLAGLSDSQLLERFAARGDDEAFAAIMARHGAMVLSVCRSRLGPHDASDAEDAFQATFLVLARRAGSFVLHGSLAGWLYRVARRVARQARLEATRRRRREQKAGPRHAQDSYDPDRDELCRLVQEELARLPERYRMPVLLCDIHGLTRDQAAEAIGCPPGTVAGRLARAREQLRGRLARRGVHPGSAWPAALAMPAEDLLRLFQRAAGNALSATRGDASATTFAAILAAKASRGLLGARLAAALTLLIALGTAGAMAVLAFRIEDPPRVEPPPGPAPTPIPSQKAEAVPLALIDPDDPATADVFVGRVLDEDGKALDGARIFIVPWSAQSGSPVPPDAGDVRTVTGADGLFRFSAKDMTFPSLDGLPARRAGLLIASARGYGPDWLPTWGETGSTFVSHTDPVKRAELSLRLPRDVVPIRGRLLGPQARPLAGATVTLTGLSIPRNNGLTAYLARHMSRRPGLFSDDGSRSLDGTAILPGVTTEATTDIDGWFRLDGIGRERLARLQIRGPGVADTSVTVMTRAAPEVHGQPFGFDQVIHGATFELMLKPGRTVTGLVRDKSSGKPLADVWVGPSHKSIRALETGRYPDATDARGRFALSGMSQDLQEVTSLVFDANGKSKRMGVVLAVPKPGQPYLLAEGRLNNAGEAVIECARGIPFRLTLRDEQGRPVDADVSYSAIAQNEFFWKTLPRVQAQGGSPLSRAARQDDGSYLGVSLPGPGAVVARTPRKAGYRPAHVDPKGFFAPGRSNWTLPDLNNTFGTHDFLSVANFSGGGLVDQHDYSAIVLVNPPEGSGTLELTATVAADRPRQVTLLDPDGRPVVGATMHGLTYRPYHRRPTLRLATFPITDLHPDRPRRITFLKADRKLVGFLLARGDGDAPYTVRMQPWATIIGRLVDLDGKPAPRATLAADTFRGFAAYDDPKAGILPAGIRVDRSGRFRAEGLVPGQVYGATLYLGLQRPSGPALEDLVLAPGEVRDLGDVRIIKRPEPAPGGAPKR